MARKARLIAVTEPIQIPALTPQGSAPIPVPALDFEDLKRGDRVSVGPDRVAETLTVERVARRAYGWLVIWRERNEAGRNRQSTEFFLAACNATKIERRRHFA